MNKQCVLISLFSSSPGSLALMNCLATVALTPASNRTSARCAKRSLPAATTYPNTPRSTAAPGPAGSSGLPCDGPTSWPKPCLWTKLPGLGSSPGVGTGSPSGLLVLREQNLQRTSWSWQLPPTLPPIFSLISLYNLSYPATSGKNSWTSWLKHTGAHTDIKLKKKHKRRRPLSPLLPSYQVLLKMGRCWPSDGNGNLYYYFDSSLASPIFVKAKFSGSTWIKLSNFFFFCILLQVCHWPWSVTFTQCDLIIRLVMDTIHTAERDSCPREATARWKHEKWPRSTQMFRVTLHSEWTQWHWFSHTERVASPRWEHLLNLCCFITPNLAFIAFIQP